MAMGIVSNKDFDSELSSLQTPKPVEKIVKQVEVIDVPAKGRGNNLEVPDALRKVIGETSAIHGRAEAVELASNFGISPSSVSAYANGSTSTSSYADQPNKDHITDAKQRISKKARA